MSKVQKNKALFWIFSSSIIAILWLFQYHITVNIPWWDDFHGIMIPVYEVFSNNTFFQKLSLLFSLNNEHRIFNDRLFMLIIYVVAGQFEMKWLAMLGFINLIGIFFLFYKVSKPYLPSIWYFLPVLFFIFHAQYYESLQSLMVPFQNFSVILYVLLSIYFVTHNSKNHVLWAAVFAIFAIFSHGNGILAFPICAMLLIIQCKTKYFLYWLSFSIIIISAYFYNYSTPAWKLEQSHTNVGIIKSLAFGFEFLGAYFLNIVEASTSLSESIFKKLLPSLFGLFLTVIYLVLFYRKYPFIGGDFKKIINKLKYSKIDLFLFGAVSFVVSTAILMAITRASFPMLSRYTINSSIFITSVYLFLVINLVNKKTTVWSHTFLAILMYLLSFYNNFDKAINFRQNVITDGVNWQKQGTWINSYSEKSHIDNLNPLLQEIYANHKYVFPNFKIENYEKLEVAIDTFKIKNEINGGYLELSNVLKNNTITQYYSLENENNKYIFPAFKVKNSLLSVIKSMKYYSEVTKSTFPIYLTQPGSYSLFLIEERKESLTKTKISSNLNVAKNGSII